MTIYLDGVWFINGFVDYLLLVVSGNLTGSPLRRGRILLSGCFGGLYATLCLVPGWGFLSGLLWRLVVAVGMCFVAFGGGMGLFRKTVVLMLLTAAFSGVVLLLTELFSAPAALVGGRVYYPVSIGSLVLTAGGAYGLISWGLGRLSHQGGDIVPVELLIAQRVIRLTAFRDTGNSLRDPISGVPVMVTDQSILKPWLPHVGALTPQILMEELYRIMPDRKPRLIPYKTVGVEHGLLVAIQPESVKIAGKKERVLLGFSPVSVSDGGGYQALLGGKLS